MDIIDQYLEPDENEQTPQTPSFQIFRKANKLRNKIKAIQIASRLAPKEREPEKITTDVFKQPDCLVAMLTKIKKEKRDNKEITTDEVNK
jgi:hypothetical protein